jgi:hypothetical protein
MLAEEYVQIVPFAYQLQSGLDESRNISTAESPDGCLLPFTGNPKIKLMI